MRRSIPDPVPAKPGPREAGPSPHAQRCIRRALHIGGGVGIAIIFLGLYALSWQLVLEGV